MSTIKVLGMGDLKTRQLRENVAQALAAYPIGNSKLVDITEVNLIVASGVGSTPALLFDNIIVSEGEVLSAEEIVRLLKRRYLFRSKLYNLKKITVPTDYSSVAVNAFRYAFKMAKAAGASITLVHFADLMFEGGAPSASGFLSNHRKVLAEELREHVEQQVQTLTEGKVADSPVKVVPKLEFGYPELGLVEISQHADLIVMGTTGKNGWAEKLFGKVSAEVSGEAHCPVLLVPPNVEFSGFSNIVYAANYESLETEKIKQVVTFAEKFDSQIHFVHVNTGDMSEPHGQQLEERLFEINYQYAASKFPFLFHHIKGDDVASALNTYAMRHHADLVVFITEHRGIWQSLLHESQSRKMMLNTRIPILVAHLHNDSIEPHG